MKKMIFALALVASFLPTAVLHADEADTEKMKEISAKQDRILQMLDEIKTELDTVKIRVTQQ